MDSSIFRRNYLIHAGIWILAAIFVLLCYLSINNKTEDLLIFLLFFCTFMLSLWKFNSLHHTPKLLAVIMVAGFLFRCYYAYTLHVGIISEFPDSFAYLERSSQVTLGDLTNFYQMSLIAQTSQMSYYYLLYVLNVLFHSNYAIYLANILLFYWSAMLFYVVIEKDFSSKIANVASIFLCLSMTMFLFTSNILKDSWTFFLFMTCFYAYRRNNTINIWVILTLTAVFTTRVYAGFSLIAALYFDYLRMHLPKVKRMHIKIVNILFPIVSMYYALKLPIFYDLFYNTSNFATKHSIFSGMNDILKGTFTMFFAPYFYGTLKSGITTSYSILEIDSAVAVICGIALIVFIIKFFRYRELRSKMYVYLIPIFVHAVTLGLTYDVGASRQRICVYGFMILLYVLGFMYKRVQKEIT